MDLNLINHNINNLTHTDLAFSPLEHYQRQIVEFAKKALNGIKEEFQSGTRSTIAVLDAQSEYFIAQTNFLKNEFSILRSELNLLWSLGILNIESIKN